MNYRESKKILAQVNKANKILINCHSRPDIDSIGSALSLYQVLKKMGKDVNVICPSVILESFNFLPFSGKIQKVSYKKFDFSKYDLFICIDSSSWAMVVGMANSKKVPIPNIPLVVIDHHKTNQKFGKINLVDDKITSSAEIIYLVLEDWRVCIDKKVASAILAGIIGDTGAFRYPGVTNQTLKIAGKLMEKGADKDEIIHNIYRSVDFNLLKFWGEVLKRMEIDEEHGFVWAAVPNEDFKRYKKPKDGKETAASNFTQIVKDTKFGLMMVEEEARNLSVSLRSRTGFDTSKIAAALGGGGHIYASGVKIEGLDFDDAVEKVLQTARKFAKKND
ncbi:MAG: bifunctional oligoribonuclease/PAP phosphatase NrnA [Patescibacteria group bacterium]